MGIRSIRVIQKYGTRDQEEYCRYIPQHKVLSNALYLSHWSYPPIVHQAFPESLSSIPLFAKRPCSVSSGSASEPAKIPNSLKLKPLIRKQYISISKESKTLDMPLFHGSISTGHLGRVDDFHIHHVCQLLDFLSIISVNHGKVAAEFIKFL